MFILKYLNIYLVQNKEAETACLMANFLAKRRKIDYAFTVTYFTEEHIQNFKRGRN